MNKQVKIEITGNPPNIGDVVNCIDDPIKYLMWTSNVDYSVFEVIQDYQLIKPTEEALQEATSKGTIRNIVCSGFNIPSPRKN
jgi:hypothetical protein